MVLTVEPGIYIAAGTRWRVADVSGTSACASRTTSWSPAAAAKCSPATCPKDARRDRSADGGGMSRRPRAAQPAALRCRRSSAAAWWGRAWRWHCGHAPLKVLLIEAVRGRRAPSSRASMIAPPHWATARAGSSTRSASGRDRAARRADQRASMFPMPATSASRGSRPREHGLDAFGYTVSNRHLGAVLWQALGERGGTYAAEPGARDGGASSRREAAHCVTVGERTGSSTVAAAGATGGGRRWRAFAGQAGGRHRLQRRATTGRWRWWPICSTDSRARGIAYERFTGLRAAGAAAAGTMAAIPWSGRCSPTGALRLQRVRVRRCSAQQLQQRFGWRAGRDPRGRRRRAAYPLALVQRARAAGAARGAGG